jgi:hypothetical protein
MAHPYRQWLTEPSGAIDVGQRQSLLKLCSSNTAIAPVAGEEPNWHICAGGIRTGF